MEDIPLIQHTEPKSWIKGGVWEVKWEWVWERAPLEEKEWGLYEGAWVYVQNAPQETQSYHPLKEEPGAYLAYADLGNHVWEAFRGKFLRQYPIDPSVPEELKERTIKFLLKFGSPFNYPQSDFLYRRSLLNALRQAQLMGLALLYQQVSTSSSDIKLLQSRISSVLGSLGDDSPAWNTFRKDFDLSTDQGTIDATESVLEDLSWRGSHLHGIGLVLDRTRDPDIHLSRETAASTWSFAIDYEHLSNVLWHQVYKAIIEGADVRMCLNERCPEPGRLFEAGRPNKLYCSTQCRNYHNVSKFRLRVKASNQLERGESHER